MCHFFGKYLKLIGSGWQRPDEMDFTWEREWRYASDDRRFTFEESDVKVALCPSDQIDEFQRNYPWVRFVDPLAL